MKCSKCGTTNGNTNKFCRECGTRLDVIEQTPAVGDICIAETDDFALGEELFALLQLYKVGELDSALSKGEMIVRMSPDSASAHSIMALIYERKAEKELNLGNIETGKAFLRSAVSHYEKIIDLNPNSGADREKLAMLRVKLNSDSGTSPRISTVGKIKPALNPVIAQLKAALKQVPTPVLASAGVFFVVLFLLIVFWHKGGQPIDEPVQARQAAGNSPSAINIMPSQSPIQPSKGGNEPVASKWGSLQVYTFKSQSASSAPPAPHSVSSQTSSRSSSMPVPTKQDIASAMSDRSLMPSKLPSLGTELSIVPVPKRGSVKNVEPVKPKVEIIKTSGKAGEISASDKTKEEPATTPKLESEAPKASGASRLASAIQMHDQGMAQEAIGTAQQAIVLFQADIDAGRNVNSAKRGIENAKKLSAYWQQSMTSGTR